MGELLATSVAIGRRLTLAEILFSEVLALLLTTLVAGVYTWTFRGMSYTRSFVHSLVAGGTVACMVMLAVNNNIAAGIGIAGSLAIVRFRTSVRDPRDIVFVFCAMGAGLASGLHAYAVGVVGTLTFCAAAIGVALLDFGAQRQFDGLLRLTIPTGSDSTEEALTQLIRRSTSWFALVTVREVAQGRLLQHAYQVRLRRADDRHRLLRQLDGIAGIRDSSLHLQDHTVEL